MGMNGTVGNGIRSWSYRSQYGRVVTNGMSQYSRAERNANAGIVVGIDPRDYPGGVLAGIEFQRKWESLAFQAGGGTYQAPGQLVGDFLAGRASTAFGPAPFSMVRRLCAARGPRSSVDRAAAF